MARTGADAGRRSGGQDPARGPGAPPRPPGAHLLWIALPLGGLAGLSAAELFGTWPGAFIGGGVAGAVASAMSHHARRARKEAALGEGEGR
ncbi:hypothetical protein ACQ5SO_09460 [Rhodovulum sp. DZ06]|uniref:hypothetical protein n=1 Tax=Rhodovulum sp. DZ06 TaxID=3425126 RepID=UPI003D342927